MSSCTYVILPCQTRRSTTKKGLALGHEIVRNICNLEPVGGIYWIVMAEGRVRYM